MKKYEIYASETVFFRHTLEAKNEEEARDKYQDMVSNGEIDMSDMDDTDGFQIDNVQLVE